MCIIVDKVTSSNLRIRMFANDRWPVLFLQTNQISSLMGTVSVPAWTYLDKCGEHVSLMHVTASLHTGIIIRCNVLYRVRPN